MEYRQRPKSDVWHWMVKCRWFPPLGRRGLKVRDWDDRPSHGELCNECIGKEKRAKANPK